MEQSDGDFFATNGAFAEAGPFMPAGEWVAPEGGAGWDDPWNEPTLTPAYTREAPIEAGGQGEVFRGRAADGRRVALKYLTLTGSVENQENERKRFGREARLQSSMQHPGIMPILGVHLDGAAPYFAMPLADESLRDRLNAAGGSGLPVEEATGIFREMLVAVEYAHSEGVIHRDLKPENVLFVADRPMLADFGLGRRVYSGSTTLTMTNKPLGTLAYCAPEQWSDAHQADVRADVFALGRIFYEMLCGVKAAEKLDLNLVPAEYRYVVHRSTLADRERRFATVAEMVREMSVFDGDDTEELLRAPSEEAKRLIASIAAGERDHVADLVRLLLQNGDDLQLYLHVLPTMPEEVLSIVAVAMPEDYHAIVTKFDEYADGSHPWSFTDTLAVFLRAVFDVTSDMRVRLLVIERMLVLGHTHNRWFVGRAFVRVVRAALQEPGYNSAVADILRAHPETHSFIRPEFEGVLLPRVIREVLR